MQVTPIRLKAAAWPPEAIGAAALKPWSPQTQLGGTVFKKLVTALAAAALVAVPVASAQAATASWTTTVNGPTMYETNRIYESVPLRAPSTTPSNGTITTLNAKVEWVYNDRTDVKVELCAYVAPTFNRQCEVIPLWSSKNHTSSYFNGAPAKTEFFYRFSVPTAKANAVFQYAQYTGKLTVTPTYSTP